LIASVRTVFAAGSSLRVEAARSATVSEEAVATDSAVTGLLDSEIVADWLADSLREADSLKD
jgi:hypothetical protein